MHPTTWETGGQCDRRKGQTGCGHRSDETFPTVPPTHVLQCLSRVKQVDATRHPMYGTFVQQHSARQSGAEAPAFLTSKLVSASLKEPLLVASSRTTTAWYIVVTAELG